MTSDLTMRRRSFAEEAQATGNLRTAALVEARQGDGTDTRGETFDAILVNAGMMRPREAWLRALRPAGGSCR